MLYVHGKLERSYFTSLFGGETTLVTGLFSVWISWVMPKAVVDLFACWSCNYGHSKSIEIWKSILLRLMYAIWRKRIVRLLKELSFH